MQVILASRSQGRLKLLRSAGLTVGVQAVEIDESPLFCEQAVAAVGRICRLKAAACPDHKLPVITADTLVSLENTILGKPENLIEAGEMLRRLSGRKHEVYSGVCVCFRGRMLSDTIRTRVQFRYLQEDEIECYLQHNEVCDKAGGYAVQGFAASFVTAIEGPLDNVIGLPVKRTLELLAETSA